MLDRRTHGALVVDDEEERCGMLTVQDIERDQYIDIYIREVARPIPDGPAQAANP